MKHFYFIFLLAFFPLTAEENVKISNENINELKEQIIVYNKQIKELQIKRDAIIRKVDKAQGIKHKNFKLSITKQIIDVDNQLKELKEQFQDSKDNLTLSKNEIYKTHKLAVKSLSKYKKAYKKKVSSIKRGRIKGIRRAKKSGYIHAEDNENSKYELSISSLKQEGEKLKEAADSTPYDEAWEIKGKKPKRQVKKLRRQIKELRLKRKQIIAQQRKEWSEKQKEKNGS